MFVAAAADVMPRPNGTAIRARMRFLTSDVLEGRDTGSRGYDIAAAYVASQFEALGLEPVGTHGSWFQPVPMLRSRVTPEAGGITIGSRRFVHERDLLFTPPPTAETHLRGQAVLVGYGIQAPEFGLRDYDTVDVRGRFAVVLNGAPATVPGEERTYLSNLRVKTDMARDRGAIGVLVIRPQAIEQRDTWDRLVRLSGAGAFYWIDGRGSAQGATTLPVAALNRSAVDALLAGSGRTYDQLTAAASRQPVIALLPDDIVFDERAELERVDGVNVVAKLEGADPGLKSESLVYTAHLDHLGITPPVDGDAVNHGAIDNASGVAELIEVARLFRDVRPRPARSLLFAVVTGEERGRLGSSAFVDTPPVPRRQIVANINLDNFLILYPVTDVVAIGGSHSSLGVTAGRAASKTGLSVIPDPRPEENLLTRNDQFSFTLRGIPSVVFANGIHSSDPAVDVPALWKEWFATVYHTPRDNMQQRFDWHAAEQYAMLNFRLGLSVASDRTPPSWNAGDFFGRKFGPNR